MKIISLLVVIIYLFLPLSDSSSVETQAGILRELIDFAEDDQLELKSWHILIKETFEEKALEEIEANLKSAGFVEAEHSKGKGNAVIKRWKRQQDYNVVETASIIQGDGTSSIDVSYQIDSKNQVYFDEHELASQLNESIGNIFTKASHNYACIRLVAGGNIDSVHFFDRIIENLSIEQINRLEEQGFTVISGYTDQWSTAIPVGDSSMNIQLASREGLGGKTTFTLGTPILTTEY